MRHARRWGWLVHTERPPFNFRGPCCILPLGRQTLCNDPRAHDDRSLCHTPMPYVEKSVRQKVLDAWFAKLPAHVATVIREQFPGVADCYLMKNTGNALHCAMCEIERFVIEDFEMGIPVTCSVLL